MKCFARDRIFLIFCVIFLIIIQSPTSAESQLLWGKEGYYAKYGITDCYSTYGTEESRAIRWEVKDVESDHAVVDFDLYVISGGEEGSPIQTIKNESWSCEGFSGGFIGFINCGNFEPYISCNNLNELRNNKIPESISESGSEKYIGMEIIETPLGKVKTIHLHRNESGHEEDNYFDYNTGILITFKGESGLKDTIGSPGHLLQPWHGTIKETNIPIAADNNFLVAPNKETNVQDQGEKEEKPIALAKADDVEQYIKNLNDQDPSIRSSAAEALGKAKDPRAIDPLIQAFNDKVFLVQCHAVDALVSIGEPSIKPLEHAFNEKDGQIRLCAAIALDMLGNNSMGDVLIQSLDRFELSNFNLVITYFVEHKKYARAIDPLIQNLKDNDSESRYYSAMALGWFNDSRAVDPLIQALKDDNHSVRLEAVRALSDIKDKRAVEPLMHVLKDENDKVFFGENNIPVNLRAGAAFALGELGDVRAVDPLIQALKDQEDGDIRMAAAAALGDLKDPRAVEPLIQALEDRYDEVRRNAAGSLGEIKDTRSVEPLIKLLKDNDNIVRGNTARALGAIGDIRATEPLIVALKDDQVRWLAVEALGKIGDSRAVDPLIQALKDNGSGNVRGRAALALGEINDTRAVEPLILTLMNDDEQTRIDAAEALGMIGKPAVGPLILLLENNNSTIQWWAAVALGNLKDSRAIDPLIRGLALGDEHWLVRRAAANALGMIGDKRSIEPLINMMRKTIHYPSGATEALAKIGEPAVDPLIQILKDDDDVYVRADAAYALGDIGNPRALEPLIQALKDENWVVRKVASDALGKIGDIGARDSLTRALNDEIVDVRKSAVEALKKLGLPAEKAEITATSTTATTIQTTTTTTTTGTTTGQTTTTTTTGEMDGALINAYAVPAEKENVMNLVIEIHPRKPYYDSSKDNTVIWHIPHQKKLIPTSPSWKPIRTMIGEIKLGYDEDVSVLGSGILIKYIYKDGKSYLISSDEEDVEFIDSMLDDIIGNSIKYPIPTATLQYLLKKSKLTRDMKDISSEPRNEYLTNINKYDQYIVLWPPQNADRIMENGIKNTSLAYPNYVRVTIPLEKEILTERTMYIYTKLLVEKTLIAGKDPRDPAEYTKDALSTLVTSATGPERYLQSSECFIII
jgi:HEAT repeat protein